MPANAEETPTVVCDKQNDEGIVDCAAFKTAKLTGPACEGMSAARVMGSSMRGITVYETGARISRASA